jgi:glycosyltransferase involved in cell wall biosynthesis
MDKISVIIPTYKSPDTLDLCLRSCIEGQQGRKNQIIVVVDGFYDINKEILEKYAKSIDILDLKENVGLCRGTNLGVYNAKYDLVLIVNDDNVFPQNWDLSLLESYQPNSVVSPNQIEPTPSMFPQFIIENLGRDPKTFDLEKFWMFDYHVASGYKVDETGSTLPIFMSKIDYLKVGGWDENYEMGMVSDWDFFLKCQLAGMKMLRTYECHFYHFASISVNGEKRRQAEMNGHEYAKYKWGSYIKHNPENNLKYI